MRFLTQRRLWMSCLSSATGRGSGSQFTLGQFLEQAPLAVAESVDCQYGEVRGRQEQFNAFCESKTEDFRWPSVALGSGTLPNSTTSEASRPLETWLARQSEDLVDVWVTETPQQETKVSEALKLNKSYRTFLTPSQTQNGSATTAHQDTRISEGMMLGRSYHLLPSFLTPSQTQNGVAKMALQETRICEAMIVDRSYHHIPAFVTPSHDLLENSRPLVRRFEHRLWGLQKQSAALEGLVGGRRQFCSAAAAKQDATKKFRNSVPVRSLVQPLPKKAGRNHSGQITIRHRGGGHKRAYRIIDFRRQDKDGVQATVSGIEYDPNRTARIALLNYTDGVKSYILAPRGLVAGDEVAAGPDADIRPGNALPLSHIPVGTTVHAIELRPGGGAQLARSAGSGAQLMRKEGKLAQLRLPSSEVRNVDVRCRATIGEVGFAERANVKWRKAGQRRWLGWRPTVRGVAMNPVDHPHGGGEGRTSGGRHPVNPSGKREGRTRRPKASDALIVRRRKSKK